MFFPVPFYNFWLSDKSVISELPSVLWRCWLGGRKGIRPLKIWSDEVLAWLSVWSEVQMICIWFIWCHCHPISSCFSKIQNGLSFCYRPTLVVLEKRPLNGCVCVFRNIKHVPVCQRLKPDSSTHTWLAPWRHMASRSFLSRSYHSLFLQLQCRLSLSLL